MLEALAVVAGVVAVAEEVIAAAAVLFAGHVAFAAPRVVVSAAPVAEPDAAFALVVADGAASVPVAAVAAAAAAADVEMAVDDGLWEACVWIQSSGAHVVGMRAALTHDVAPPCRPVVIGAVAVVVQYIGRMAVVVVESVVACLVDAERTLKAHSCMRIH